MNEAHVLNSILTHARALAAPGVRDTVAATSRILDVIDSFSFVELIQFVQDELRIEIDFASAEPEDLTRFDRLAQFIARRR